MAHMNESDVTLPLSQRFHNPVNSVARKPEYVFHAPFN